MKIIIAGDGKVGNAVTRQLSLEPCDLTVIDSRQRVLTESQEASDVMVLQGNAASMPVLRAAGAANADLLIAATGADEINLLSCLTARSMNPHLHTIARVRSTEYAEQQFAMREQLGLSMAVNPAADAANEIRRALQYPALLRRETFSSGRVEIVEVKVNAGSCLDGVELKNLGSVCQVGVLVCVIMRNGTPVIPKGSDVLKQGDTVYITAPSENLASFIKNIGLAEKRIRRVLIVGGGNLGYHTASRLLRSGYRVKLIESDYNVCLKLSEMLPQATIICGDGCQQKLLDSEGIGETDAFISLTGSDEQNLVVSMYASRKKVEKIITRVERIENLAMFGEMGVGTIISPKDICANTIVRYVRAMQQNNGSIQTLTRIANNQVEALEFIITPDIKHAGKPLKDMPIRKGVLIACITRRGQAILPNGLSSFEIGDRAIVVADGVNVRDFNDIFA